MNFIYKPANIRRCSLHITEKMCPQNISDFAALKISDDIMNGNSLSDEKELAEFIIWAYKKEEYSLAVDKIINTRMSVPLLKYIYFYWQNNFSDTAFNEFCLKKLFELYFVKKLINNRSHMWLRRWHDWMTACDILTAAAGTAAMICESRKISLNEFKSECIILQGTMLDEKMTSLLHCFRFEDENITDDELADIVSGMRNKDRKKLFYEFLVKYPLFKTNGELIPDNDFYTVKYKKTVKILAEGLLEEKYAVFVSNIVTACDIENAEHSQFWQYDFLREQPLKNRFDTYRYVHCPEQSAFKVIGDNHVIVDLYEKEMFCILDKASCDDMRYDHVSEENCFISGNEWKRKILQFSINYGG